MQRAVCASGPVEDEAVRASARAALAAWGRLAVFGDGSGGGSGSEEEKRSRNGGVSSSSPSSTSSSSGPVELLERTERDIEELLRDGVTRGGGGGGGGEYTKKLREPPFLSSQKKHISFS